MTQAAPVLLTKAEAAEICRVSIKTLDRRVLKTLPTIKIGCSIRIKREDLETWLEQQRVTVSTLTPRVRNTSAGAVPSPANDGTSPQAHTILSRLRAEQQTSTETPATKNAEAPRRASNQ